MAKHFHIPNQENIMVWVVFMICSINDMPSNNYNQIDWWFPLPLLSPSTSIYPAHMVPIQGPDRPVLLLKSGHHLLIIPNSQDFQLFWDHLLQIKCMY